MENGRACPRSKSREAPVRRWILHRRRRRVHRAGRTARGEEIIQSESWTYIGDGRYGDRVVDRRTEKYAEKLYQTALMFFFFFLFFFFLRHTTNGFYFLWTRILEVVGFLFFFFLRYHVHRPFYLEVCPIPSVRCSMRDRCFLFFPYIIFIYAGRAIDGNRAKRRRRWSNTGRARSSVPFPFPWNISLGIFNIYFYVKQVRFRVTVCVCVCVMRSVFSSNFSYAEITLTPQKHILL